MKISSSHRLRPLEEKDLTLVLAWRNHPKVRVNMYTSHVISAEEHRNWYERTKDDPSRLYFIYEQAGVPYCVTGLSGIDPLSSQADTLLYGAPQTPLGSSFYASFLLFRYAFIERELHKLNAEIIAYNEALMKMNLKYGYKKEAILRDHHFFDGRFHDVYRLGLLAADWKKLNAKNL